MRRLLFFLSFTVFSTFPARSQEAPDTLIWRQGIQLQVNDFRKQSQVPDLGISYHYSYRFEPAGLRGLRPLVKSYVVFNRKNSGLGEDITRNSLRYAQLIFDLSGYQSRKVDVRVMELDLLPFNESAARSAMEQIFTAAEQDFLRERQALDEALYMASDSDEKIDRILTRWQEKTRSDLQSLPQVTIRESLTWQIGVFVGVGRSFLTGNTSRCFTDPTAFNLGFEFDFRQSRIGLDTRLGFNRTRQEIERKGHWPSGTKTGHAYIEITYGYKIAKRNLLIVPYAGLAINEFTPRKADEEDKRRVQGYSPVAGLEINHIFARKDDSREKVAFFYKGKLSCSPANFIAGYGGTQVNLSLSIGFDAALKRRKMAVVGS